MNQINRQGCGACDYRHNRLFGCTKQSIEVDVTTKCLDERFDTVEEAQAERENITKSLNDGLVIAGIRYQELKNSDEIVKAYRRCMK